MSVLKFKLLEYREPITPELVHKRRKELLLGLFSGILMGISFPPFHLPYLMFVGLIPYFFVIEKRNGLAEINRFTYFTAFIFNLITLYWVGSWTPDTDPFLMIAGIALLIFNPLLFLIPSTLYYSAKKYINRKTALWLFPFFWVTYEYLYSLTDFRFPWLTLGHGQAYFLSYIQIADIIGAYGISLLLLFFNVFIYKAFKHYLNTKKFHWGFLLSALLLLIIPLIYGNYRINTLKLPKKTIRVGLIQPNFNPWKKWEAENLDNQLNIYLNLSQEAVNKGAKLIVWPETALPVYLLSGAYPAEVNRIRNFIDTNNVFLLTGMPDIHYYPDSSEAPPGAYKTAGSKVYYTAYNGVLGFQPNINAVQHYGKIKLVPFGERVPFLRYFPFLGKIFKWNVGISSWNVGRDTTVFKFQIKTTVNNKVKIDTIKTAGIVCIESIYSIFDAAFVRKGAEMIAVVTNDSWYGNSSGPYQHKEISVLRAIENRRSVVRAANGGISTIINPLGKTLSQTKMFTRTFLVGNVVLNNKKTFFTLHPLIIPYLSLTISLIMIILYLIIKFSNKLKTYNEKENRFTK